MNVKNPVLQYKTGMLVISYHNLCNLGDNIVQKSHRDYFLCQLSKGQLVKGNENRVPFLSTC